MGKSCNHPCCGEVCRRPKQRKVRKPVRKVSKKRVKENKKYSTLRKQFLEDHPVCEARLEGCTGVADQVHHKAGRVVDKFLDVSTWLPVCANCHHWIELHPEESKELNLSKSRLIK